MASLESQLSEPNSLVPLALWRHLNSHYPAEHGTIAIVGDFDPDEIVPVLEEAFDGWRSDEPYERVPNVYRAVAVVTMDIETPDKTNAVMYAGHGIPLREDHADYPALVLADYMLGGGFLNSRLPQRIRQEEGLSYGVGSLLEEVAGAKKGYLDTARNARADDMSVARTLANNLYLGRTMDFVAKQEEAIAALTPTAVHEALKRHIDLERFSIFRGGDFANKLVAE